MAPGEGSSTGRAKRTAPTPRPKHTLRADKFYAYEWDSLRVNLLKGFLLAVCDQDGWDYNIDQVLSFNLTQALAEVEAFAAAVDVDFPWADDLEMFLEIGDFRHR